MVSISNVDLVMAALRSRLRRVAAEKRSGKTVASSAPQSTRSTGRERIEALAAMRQLPPDEFERTLVRAVLEMELGEAISEDPRFHRLVDQTHRILQEDPELRKALRQVQLGRS
jgi:hypothetical protein